MDWFEIIPILIPALIAALLAVISLVLKLKKDSMKGMGKEVSELLITIVDAAKDRKFTTSEVRAIIEEAQDVIEEAQKLLETK